MTTQNILIIEARFYEEIADELVSGAIAVIETAGGCFERLSVPGILEIPAAARMAVKASEKGSKTPQVNGLVVLGCAIKGETDHYEHVCREAVSGIQKIAIEHTFPVGNGILTCPNRTLALERSSVSGQNFGARAALACLRMIEIRQELGL